MSANRYEKAYFAELGMWGVRDTLTGNVEIVPTEGMADFNVRVQNETEAELSDA